MQNYSHGLTAKEIRGLVGESPLMLEIGSHEGTDTAKFLAVMPGIVLHCFDPESRANARFKQMIGDDPRVTLIEKAVADIDGELPFYGSTGEAGGRKDWDFSGSLRRPTGHLEYAKQIKFKPPVAVPCIQLDSWSDATLPPGAIIDFIWADIQGAQRQVLAGGQRTIAATRYLYMESHNVPKIGPLYDEETTHDELVALLPGFEPLGIYERDNILFKNRTL